MPFVRAGGVKLHYLGRGTGPQTVVFLHGYAGMADMWRPVLGRLPADCHAIALDMRGSGGSDKPPSGYTIDAFTRDLTLVVEALALPPFVLVGHSMGGAVGLSYALDQPEHLRGLVLVNPAPADGAFHSDPDTLAHAAAAMAGNPALLRAFCDAITERDVAPDIIQAAYQHAAAMTPEYLRECVESMLAFDVAGRLPDLQVPALVVAGDCDRQVPLERSLRTFRAIPNARLQVFQRVGHAPQIEVTEAFVEVLVDFLAHSARPSREGLLA